MSCRVSSSVCLGELAPELASSGDEWKPSAFINALKTRCLCFWAACGAIASPYLLSSDPHRTQGAIFLILSLWGPPPYPHDDPPYLNANLNPVPTPTLKPGLNSPPDLWRCEDQWKCPDSVHSKKTHTHTLSCPDRLKTLLFSLFLCRWMQAGSGSGQRLVDACLA